MAYFAFSILLYHLTYYHVYKQQYFMNNNMGEGQRGENANIKT